MTIFFFVFFLQSVYIVLSYDILTFEPLQYLYNDSIVQHTESAQTTPLIPQKLKQRYLLSLARPLFAFKRDARQLSPGFNVC